MITELPECNMYESAGVPCKNDVTHVGAKGWVYCAKHAPERRGWEATRKLREWERDLLREGKPVPSYRPISKSEHLARVLAAAESIKAGRVLREGKPIDAEREAVS